jgi:predicted polyphosphate/ATP-dependent NAD kinase
MSLRVGLIVNAIAGVGGSVALRGSDGVADQALALGALPQAVLRATEGLNALREFGNELIVLTGSGSLGANAASAAGLNCEIVYRTAGISTAEDTASLARRLMLMQVDLLLFAGGDGTARDVAESVGDAFPVLGIPAGVKMYSGAFATTPTAAGTLAVRFLRSSSRRLRHTEVMDLDESDLRCGRMEPSLFGYVSSPDDPRLLQGKKVRSAASESVQAQAIAASVVESMEPEQIYLIGPGSTTWAVKQSLKGPASTLSVDAYVGGKLVLHDATASALLQLTAGRSARILVTCIGGQGHIFGRGNQQFSPELIRRVGRKSVAVLATPSKLISLTGRPFIADMGDPACAAEMTGYVEVVNGYRSKALYRCEAF